MLSVWDTGGKFIQFCNAINEYTTHHADFIRYGTNYLDYPYDICLDKGLTARGDNSSLGGTNEIRKILSNADIFHIDMGDIDFFRSRGIHFPYTFLKINLEQYLKGKKVIYHHSGMETRRQGPAFSEVYREYKQRVLVSTPDLLQHLATCDVHYLPNMCPMDKTLYKPVERELSPVYLTHCPTVPYKGTGILEDIIPRINLIVEDFRYIPVVKKTHLLCLQLKQRCHILFDQIYPQISWYGNNAIEAASQGLVVLNNPLDKRYRKYIPPPPFIEVNNSDELEDSILDLVNNRKKITEIGKASREWIRISHDSRRIVKKLLRHYQLAPKWKVLV